MGEPYAARAAPILAAALALIAAAPCGAATTRLSASLGFGGFVVPGRWNPLWARSDGGAGTAGEGSIQVVLRSEDGSAIGIETFPCKDGLRVECPVMVDERLQSISVRLVSSGEILAEEKIAARSRLFPGHVVLVCGEGSIAELAISAALYPAEPVQAVSLGLGDLPSRGLDYDAVSAVVLRDPGRAIAPAQRDAMVSWIAGGGRLAVTAPRRAGESVLASLFPGLDATRADQGRSSLPYGLGAVELVRESASSERPGEAERRWRAALALSPYGSSERLTASRAFKSAAASFPKDPRASRAEVVLLVALALWAAIAALASRNRKKSLLPVIAAAAASFAFALALAAPLEAMLRRGARVSTRALVLPEDGSAIVSIGVRTSFGDALREFLSVKALRGLRVEYGSLEGGLMSSASSADGAAFEWSHALPKAALSLRSSSRDALDLAGIIEFEALEGSGFPREALDATFSRELPELESSGRLAFALAAPGSPSGAPPGGSPGEVAWLSRSDGRWVPEPTAPSWVGNDASWIDALRSIAPGRPFLVGRCFAPALGLSVGGSAAAGLLWAMPVAARPVTAMRDPGGGSEARP